MTQTVAQLGARALRKIRVSMIAQVNVPGDTITWTPQQLGPRVLREIGIIVPEASRPSTLTYTAAQIAARAVRDMGIVVPDASRPPTLTYTSQALALRAVRDLGIVIPDASRPPALPPVALADLGARTLQAVGVNPVAESLASSPAATTITVTEIAARSLRAVGVSPDSPLTDYPPGTEPTSAPTDVAKRVLIRLGIIDPVEAPTAADQGEAFAVVNDVISSLQRLGIGNWANTAMIPFRAVEQVIVMAAQMCASSFGRTPNMQAYSEAENELRMQELTGGDGQTRAEAEVNAVHDRLAAMNIVTWAAIAIPQYAAAAYVSLVTNALVPVHSSATPGGTIQAAAPATTRMAITEQAIANGAPAIAELRRIALSGTYGQSLAEAKVSAVHEAMSSLGFVSWLVSAVPAAYSEDYVTMAATLLAPTMGFSQDAPSRQIDQAAWSAAENRIKRGVQVAGALTLATDRISTVHGELVAMGVAQWPLTAIPETVADAYVEAVVNVMSPAFDGKFDADLYALSISRIKKMAQIAGALTLAEDRVSTVHGELVALAIASWTLAAIPETVADAYVEMVVNVMAPAFDEKFDPATYELSIGRIKRQAQIMGAEALAESLIGTAHSDLSGQNLVSWLLSEIPNNVADAYVEMAANSMRPSFDGKFDPEAYAIAVKRVKLSLMGGPMGQALAEQKVRAVHASLDARGKTRWSLLDLPDYCEEPYVQMAAYLLATECEIKFDPNWWADGERQINQLIVLPATDEPVRATYF